MKTFEILFVGYYVLDSDGYSGISIAGNKMQGSIVNAMAERTDTRLQIISIPPFAPFPKEKKVFIKRKSISTAKLDITYVPFINLPIVKQITQTLGVFVEMMKAYRHVNYVVTFNLFPQIGIPAYLLKKKCKIVPIIADVPIDDSSKRNFISSFLRKIFDKLTLLAMRSANRVIVLNENTASDFFEGKPFLVVEGGLDSKLPAFDFIPNKTMKNIVYTGALTKYSGILNLIEAFKLLKLDDVELHIYGKGDLEKQILLEADQNRKIKYFGNVNSNEIRRKQNEAYVLVNPRIVDDRISRYTFPSKLIEYLNSGAITVSTIHQGMPVEYRDLIFGTESSSPESICLVLEHVFQENQQTITEHVKSSQLFIKENKSWEKQVDRILSFLMKE